MDLDNWAVLSDEQMSNKVGVKHQPDKQEMVSGCVFLYVFGR